jgi:ubiquinone/menaquinone biosynthesis C-methylase UbiE
MKDKDIEKLRYNNFSLNRIENNNSEFLNILGADNFERYLQDPYLKYQELIKLEVFSNSKLTQLDLCCGDGMHSFTAAIEGAEVIALDYAENSIAIARKRSELIDVKVNFQVQDVNILPFLDNSFDIVTCAGSLSYLDHVIFTNEVKRVLKKNGKLIVIDSFNHNFFYRLNRFLHFLKGQRTYSTLKRMPNNKLLNYFKNEFSELNVRYYGIFIFIVPLLNVIFTHNRIQKIITTLDQKFYFLRKYSFKIVFIAKK